jgi:hypothetical protein
MLLAGSTKAQQSFSALQLSIAQGSNYQVSIDGILFNMNAGSINFDEITPGYHTISVAYSQQTGWNTSFINLYNGVVHFEPNIRKVARVESNGTLTVLRRETLFTQGNYQPAPNQRPGNRNRPSWGNQFMSTQDFQQLLNSVNGKSFDSDKLTIARQAAKFGTLSAAQTRDLCKAFDFESNRLTFAKSAYDFSRDKQNYYVVNDAFDFSSSIRELERHMSQNP